MLFREAVKIGICKQIMVAASILSLVFVTNHNLQVHGCKLGAFYYWNAFPGGKVQNGSKVLNPVPRAAPAPCWWNWVQVKLAYDFMTFCKTRICGLKTGCIMPVFFVWCYYLTFLYAYSVCFRGGD